MFRVRCWRRGRTDRRDRGDGGCCRRGGSADRQGRRYRHRRAGAIGQARQAIGARQRHALVHRALLRARQDLPPAIAHLQSTHGLPTLLGRLVDYLEADFRRWPEFDKSPRSAAHSALGVIELMPIADAKEYSFKYVNGHPGNTKLGLSTVVAFGVLADMDTGMPTLISELTLTTALRTAATSVMAAKLLARKDAYGIGVLSRLPLGQVTALDLAGDGPDMRSLMPAPVARDRPGRGYDADERRCRPHDLCRKTPRGAYAAGRAAAAVDYRPGDLHSRRHCRGHD
mgnify:CR=1 FL=1